MSDPNQKPIMKDNVAFIDDWGQHISQCEEGGILSNSAHGTTDIDAEGSNGVVRLDFAHTVHTPPLTIAGQNETFFLGLDEAEELARGLAEAIQEAKSERS